MKKKYTPSNWGLFLSPKLYFFLLLCLVCLQVLADSYHTNKWLSRLAEVRTKVYQESGSFLSQPLLSFKNQSEAPKSKHFKSESKVNPQYRSANIEGAPCLPYSMLPCDQLSVPLPFTLDFTGSEVGIPDKNGLGTGFTMVDAYSGTRLTADGTPSDPSVPGYESGKLTVIGGQLMLQTNKGIAYLTNNNQVNALGVRVDNRGKLQIETTLVKPYNGTSGQQVGVWFGLNDKTFVKLMMSESKISMRKEVNDVSGSSDTRTTAAISGLSQRTVQLRLIVDLKAGTIEGFYSTDGITYNNVGASYTTKTLNIGNMGFITNPTFAGIYATHRSSSTPVTFTFENFSISRENSAPTVVQAPTDQSLTSGQNFQFPAGVYQDADAWDTLSYSATLADGSPLPSWLYLDAATLNFTGTAPTAGATISVKVTATDQAQASVSATFSISVENNQLTCKPISNLPCAQVAVSLPYNLTFDNSIAYSLADKNGLGTGFTMADAYSGTRLAVDGTPSDPNVPGYEPGKLTLINGQLRLLTNKGIAFLNSNNQLNALGVQVESRGKLRIETTLVNPFNGTSGQQGGIWYGLSDKTFVKLVVANNKVELRREFNDASATLATDQRITGSITGLNSKTVSLRLVVDLNAQTVEGFYSTNGTTYLNVGATYSTKTVNVANMGFTTNPTYTGIFATHRNSTTAVTYTFDRFAITRENTAPTVVQAPTDQNLLPGRSFQFSAGTYQDADASDVLSYSATLADGSPLPSWLYLDVATLTFTGTAPATGATLAIKVTATDQAQAAVSTNFNMIVPAACYPISNLDCERLQVSLPVNYTFESSIDNTLPDKSGLGTGFTMVDAYSGTRLAADGTPSDPAIPGYESSKLTLTGGTLKILTNKGISYLTNNNQINALGVKLDSRVRLQIETTLIKPINGSSGQQGGLWFGLNDKSLVKLMVTANKVTMRKEINDVSSDSDTRSTAVITGLNNQNVRLRLIVDPVANTVESFYSVDGMNYVNVGSSYTTKTLNISNMGLTANTAYAGVYGTHRNSSTATTYTFDNFSVESVRPYVTAVRPANNATNQPLDQSISVDLKFPSGKSIDGNTVNTHTVKLYTVAIGGGKEVVGTAVNATAAGDAITLSAPLAPNTTYEFFITDQVKDGNSYAMVPFKSRFTTTNTSPETPTDLMGVSFSEYTLVDSTFGNSGFTSLVIGPDRRLYAASSNGKIERWDIQVDGTISNRVTISPFGTNRRLLIGFRFDPRSTSTNLVAWVSHSSGLFTNVPDWSSKISKIDVTNPTNPIVQDYVTNLPRSYKDHSVNSIDFGPDSALYFVQGSNTAMGDLDPAWGNRPERLLAGAVLRFDIKKAQQKVLPIDAKTEEGGTYNPYAPDAPLTIYATGVRNAYDLVWHSNGQLYVPTNGSAAGGSTPALSNGSVWSNGQVYTGPNVPAMTNVGVSQSDYLFRVQQGGYYGHPNALRHEYIMNGGNPTDRQDPGEVVWSANGVTYGYPVGTPVEPNFRGWSYDFGLNISPNGIIEFKSNAFNGKLKGKMLVCRFSGGDDIMVLEPGTVNKDIIQATEGIKVPGLRRPFANPLDIAEDILTGNLYVSEYYDGNGGGRPRITLLKANQAATPAARTASKIYLHDDNIAAEAESSSHDLKIYPNPNPGDGLFVQIKHFGKRETVHISMHTVAGELVKGTSLVTDANGNASLKMAINKSTSSGMYIIKAQSANSIRYKKLVIQ